MRSLYFAIQCKRGTVVRIIERTNETQILTDFLSSNRPEFLAVYGRRRVGKTYLIKNFFSSKTCTFLSMTGIKDGSFLEQRSECCKQISQAFYAGINVAIPKTWLGVFELLNKAIINVPTNKKIVVFFDEFPWMATPRSRLLQALEYYWNQYWSNNKRVKLIICGSLASWIIKNIIKNTGGLYNRVTYRLELQPLNLKEVKTFLTKKGISLKNDQILSLYRAIGGIPLYLDQVKKGLSAAQLIDSLCFSKNGLLVDEFNELFKSLFLSTNTYIELTREIAKHPYGISKIDLAKNLNLSHGGGLNERLQELEDAGFIMSFLPYQHQEKGTFFRIIDEYTLFYFRWIEPNLRAINRAFFKQGYWLSQTKTSAYQAWRGYSFESICYKHTFAIIKALEINVSSHPYSWRYIPAKGSLEQGAQIDLLFDRNDESITLCEIKYTDEPFVIDKAYAEQIKRKMAVFQNVTRTKKQLFFAMIVSSGLKKTIYSEELISHTVTLDDLFLREATT